jgi:ATP-dependent DNA helicase DinG
VWGGSRLLARFRRTTWPIRDDAGLLLTFLSAKAADALKRTGNNLAQVDAGTGTGKTVASCLAAIVASKLLQNTVIVSTATVALQEQLFHKDLPRLAAIIPDLHFEFHKGCARYVCESRLNAAIKNQGRGSFSRYEFQEMFSGESGQVKDLPRDTAKALVRFKSSVKRLQSGKWDGDIDSLEQPPEPQVWRRVQVDAQACNGGQCEHFRSCAFFRAVRQATTATLQVANHALILATLQVDSRLIDAGNTLFVFDEAHHLPTIASEQFTYRARLGAGARLLTSLRTLAVRY